MKNLKAQFKLVVFILLILNIFNFLSAKNIDKFSNSKDLSNYFSGIVSITKILGIEILSKKGVRDNKEVTLKSNNTKT